MQLHLRLLARLHLDAFRQKCRANGADSRTATTSLRVGRLEFMFASGQTRVYGRTSRRRAASPTFAVANSFTVPVQSAAPASAQSTNAPCVPRIVVGGACTPGGNPSAVIVIGPLKPPLWWMMTSR